MTLWDSRDAPVPRNLVDHPPEHGVLETNFRSDQPRRGLPALREVEFYRAVEILGDAGYVAWSGSEGEGGGGRYYFDFQVTGEGKRVMGLSPRRVGVPGGARSGPRGPRQEGTDGGAFGARGLRRPHAAHCARSAPQCALRRTGRVGAVADRALTPGR